ncbi:hypothetical protein EMIHUDRAFT_432517 [Emiliania huxleyi CCMP1516]|uniref:Uncharacterized protein n=2 Tax=Emiliania huxleyi TaxID=2903 RepID=A0A0D3IP59_EMIH1|nr:hypothetical protein EMIHUDRAFT_445920 [Emiliania huxleyi CCMP1516]XP_005767014.1 hypothetical protein EMIHUDRAFT_432517 [Emiliania huxleyi CCMP1516]EOD13044.1 hypothetical protein EMIHUDRAFT_445920 [Emiliania huxleyi CCMP1516]EOD14585.1 hypothetical protein EMIHUDRAFT_432517 [Emiliania huxleyi CCMP1516]|eukprot:XP_005765473.1 hypothetical protein EMIHUDRAFT_445920 [Emiliania huxleyi CCMP1516]
MTVTQPTLSRLGEVGLTVSPKLSPRLADTSIRLEHALTKDVLNRKLSERPSLRDLVDAGVMKPTSLSVSPCLAGPAEKLELSLRHDRLGRKLGRRPSRELVTEAHILRTASHLDPSLAPAADALQQQRKRDAASDRLRSCGISTAIMV